MHSGVAIVLVLACSACRAVNGAEEPVIRVEVTLPRTTVTLGEPVGVNLRITNPSDREVLVETECSSIINVRDASRHVVYPFPSMLTGTCRSPDEPLAAGASITKRLVWATHRVSPSETNGVVLYVDPGVYEVRAAVRQSLTARDVESTPLTVTITPPPG